jgi:hypothetical protein
VTSFDAPHLIQLSQRFAETPSSCAWNSCSSSDSGSAGASPPITPGSAAARHVQAAEIDV